MNTRHAADSCQCTKLLLGITFACAGGQLRGGDHAHDGQLRKRAGCLVPSHVCGACAAAAGGEGGQVRRRLQRGGLNGGRHAACACTCHMCAACMRTPKLEHAEELRIVECHGMRLIYCFYWIQPPAQAQPITFWTAVLHKLLTQGLSNWATE